MSRIAGARRERFLPYRYARGGIELTITGCTVDGGTKVPIDGEGHVLDLEGTWSHASIAVRVAVPGATLAAIGEGEPATAFEIAIVTRCPATLLRDALRVPVRAADEATTWTIDLHRDDLSGSATLLAYLSRVEAHGSKRALVRGARVAESRQWEVRVDRAREPRGEYLDIRYKKFSEDQTLPARDRGNLYVLDFDQDSPILWINADHDRVAGILDTRGTIGRTARLRESFFDHIAYAVWAQLFMRAATDTLAGEGEATYAWHDVVLDLLLRDVFPEVRDGEGRRQRLLDMKDDLPALMRRLDAGLQRRNDLAAHLAKLVEEDAS